MSKSMAKCTVVRIKQNLRIIRALLSQQISILFITCTCTRTFSIFFSLFAKYDHNVDSLYQFAIG